MRRGCRAVDCTGLENRHRGDPIEGSNPSLSARISRTYASPFNCPASPCCRNRRAYMDAPNLLGILFCEPAPAEMAVIHPASRCSR